MPLRPAGPRLRLEAIASPIGGTNVVQNFCTAHAADGTKRLANGEIGIPGGNCSSARQIPQRFRDKPAGRLGAAARRWQKWRKWHKLKKWFIPQPCFAGAGRATPHRRNGRCPSRTPPDRLRRRSHNRNLRPCAALAPRSSSPATCPFDRCCTGNPGSATNSSCCDSCR